MLFIIYTFFGCAATTTGAAGQALLLGPEASGGAVSLNPGQQMTLSLPSNPSTGYDWRVVKCDTLMLRLDEDAYVPPLEPRIGKGGTRTFSFSALTKGSTVLELAYYRPWEDVQTAEDWFQLIVEIR